MNKILVMAAAMLAVILVAGAALAEQHVYVPSYSHIYFGDKPSKILLTATLSIRNTDPANVLTVISARYLDSHGKQVRQFVQKPLEIKPLSSTRFVVPETDETGGSGASFIVHWDGPQGINQPVIQAVMIGASANQGISFICQGHPMRNTP